MGGLERNDAAIYGSDAELVRGIQTGDRRAFTELHDRFVTLVERTCGRILIRSEDVEDATQEVFLRAYLALQGERREMVLGPWMKTLARNIAIDMYRRNSRNRAHPTDSFEDAPDDRSPEVLLIDVGPGRLDEVMHRLPDRYASALRMRAVSDLSHKELALRLQSTPERVKALLHRARQAALAAWDSTADSAA
ncbi:MAG: sigma-70 family RNA polymerase sigma factor [Actinobacteria bacterium]|nr:sigma-70 family RNA polymerase sigma factor [Actinomycetota bacterium]